MKVYHGTSMENYLSMLYTYGDKVLSIKDRTWMQSDPYKMYFWTNDDALESAYRSACMTAAVHNSEYKYVIVLEGDLPDEICVPDSSECADENAIEIFVDEFDLDKFKPIVLKYIPEHRAKYLYNIFNNTCGVRWHSIDNFVHDRNAVLKELLELCDIVKEHEYRFPEISYNNIEEMILDVKNELYITVAKKIYEYSITNSGLNKLSYNFQNVIDNLNLIDQIEESV